MAMYEVVLNAAPTADVTIRLISGSSGWCCSPSTRTRIWPTGPVRRLTFTAENWSDSQTVTVTGVSDVNADDAMVNLEHGVSSSDEKPSPRMSVFDRLPTPTFPSPRDPTEEEAAKLIADRAALLRVMVSVTDASPGIRLSESSLTSGRRWRRC